MLMSLPPMIKELLNPDRYPEPTTSVKLIQTHISFVLLTDNYVYKIKKTVNFGFLDFTSMDKRHFFCQQEIELNRRLAGRSAARGKISFVRRGGLRSM